MLQTLAILCGIGPEVAALLDRRVLSPGPKLATLLKERRARLGITKRVISTLCHLTHSQIALYEDHNNVPGVATICKLADGYGIPAELIILATLNTQGLLNLPAPGAKITPRIRTRMRKPE